MADILADYREWRTQQAARVSTHSNGCHMWHEQCMIHRLAAALAAEQAKRTLTDAEREAIERAIDKFDGIEDSGVRDASARCSLRALLERTRHPEREGFRNTPDLIPIGTNCTVSGEK
jgi:hypothetical protein